MTTNVKKYSTPKVLTEYIQSQRSQNRPPNLMPLPAFVDASLLFFLQHVRDVRFKAYTTQYKFVQNPAALCIWLLLYSLD